MLKSKPEITLKLRSSQPNQEVQAPYNSCNLKPKQWK